MKLLALDITHLTDARYFSARGAHYIGYAADRCTTEEVLAIDEWVDGPRPFLSWSAPVDIETIWSWVDRTGIQHVLLDAYDEDVITQLPDVQWMAKAISVPAYLHDEMNTLLFMRPELEDAAALPHQERFLICGPEMEVDQRMLEGFDGVAVSGSAESDIGWKDYGDLDDLLDQIDIDW